MYLPDPPDGGGELPAGSQLGDAHLVLLITKYYLALLLTSRSSSSVMVSSKARST